MLSKKNKKLLKEGIESKTLSEDMIAFALMKTGYTNKYLANLLRRYRGYSWLKNKFSDKIGKIILPKEQAIAKKRVWICWLQGMNNAPKIVQSCYKSVKYWLSDWEIVLITKDNIQQYVDFPEFIIEKWKKGIISNTQLADLLRVELVIRYGGLWLDATTYLTGKLPEYVEQNNFFVYRDGWLDQEIINMANWFMYSKKTNNILLLETRELLYRYWGKYNFLKAYLLMPMFFRMVTDKYKFEWEQVDYINQIDQHLLMWELDKNCNEIRLEQAKMLTSVHKLTYKFDLDKEDLIINKLNNLYLK